MKNETERKKVAQITRWWKRPRFIKDGGDTFNAEVVFHDGETAVIHDMTDAEWKTVKAEELEHELAERNVERVRDFGPFDAEQVRRRTFIMSCRELYVAHLCAWCRSYFITGWGGEEYTLIRLEDDEFEATRTTGESHGCCKECRDGMLAACRDMKAEKTKNDTIPLEIRLVAGQRDALLTKLRFANDEITTLRSEYTDFKNDTEEIERERDAAYDLSTDMDDQLSTALTAVKQMKDVVAHIENKCDVMQLELDEARARLEDAEGK